MEKSSTLLRQLGLVSATALVVSNMVGSGIFTTSGFLARDLGDPTWLFAIWIVGAVVSLAGAFCYSELGVNFPSSGGEYVYLTQAYGPVWGFMTGWASLFAGFSAPIAASALAFSSYVGYFFPAFRQDAASLTLGPEWFELRIGGAQILACALIALLTVINILGVLRAAKFQNVLTGAKITILIAFIFFALAAGNGDWAHFSQPAVRESTNSIFAQFAISLCFIYTAYSGWNAATYVAEELKQPARTLPLALSIGTGLVALLFILMNVIFLYAIPMEEMKGVLAVGALAASKLFGHGVAGLFSGLMALSLVPTINAMVTVGPRVYYAMAKNGAFLRMAANVDPRWHTPVQAIVLQGADNGKGKRIAAARDRADRFLGVGKIVVGELGDRVFERAGQCRQRVRDQEQRQRKRAETGWQIGEHWNNPGRIGWRRRRDRRLRRSRNVASGRNQEPEPRHLLVLTL